MSRNANTGPRLPKALLDKVGGGSSGKSRGAITRKDRRKAQRQQKKSVRPRPPPPNVPKRDGSHAKRNDVNSHSDVPDLSDPEDSPESQAASKTKSGPPKSIMKKRTAAPSPQSASESDYDRGDDDSEGHHLGTDLEGDVEGSMEDEYDDELQVDLGVRYNARTGSPTISQRAAKAGLVANDAEIAALEKKLGLKGKSRDDDLDFLLGDLGDLGSASEDEGRRTKRKRPEDDRWLRDKRLKATGVQAEKTQDDDMEDEVDAESMVSNPRDSGSANIENPFSDDELSDDDFEGFDSATEPAHEPKKQRENPYVAPVPASTRKYIPPSLRKPAASDEEDLKQLRKQLQGQLNRLSEANLLSILQAVEQIYEKNARQFVTSTLIDLLIGLTADPSVLNDTFLILHASFAAAVYKVIGTDFGAQLLEKLVEAFDQHRNVPTGKQSLNLLAFLTNLYSFQVVGSSIMYDYIRMLLEELSENNTELLLRVIRIAGTQLRQEDPTSLKDIVLLLQRSVAKVGEQNLSVRTKFMIETINNLKNNRVKNSASATTAEHTTRMKKTVGTLNSRSIKATEPLRITLNDIRDSEKKGKWWLVGASYHDPAKLVNGDSTTSTKHEHLDGGYESETPGHISLPKLARKQGMNTDIRRAIFIAIMSASDYKDAHLRLMKLHLTSTQEREMPRVLLHCAGSEQVHNPFYTLIARRLCGEPKLRKAFQSALWNLLGQLNKDEEVEEETGFGEATALTTKKVVNLAKLYGALLSDGLGISNLKTMEFGLLPPKAATFAEVLLTTLMLQAHKKGSDTFEVRIKEIFSQAQSAPGMVQGLQYFIEATLSNAGLAGRKSERKVIKAGCQAAITALVDAAEGAIMLSQDSDSE